ncbi:MAG: hypothetical protein ACYC2U_05780 [Candidatus Amoebophilus sp.]
MYSTNKRITAAILLCSQLLTITSCSNYPNIPTQPKVARTEKGINKRPSKDDSILPLVDSLVVTSADGKKLDLKYKNENWQAALITEDVVEHVLPIVLESGYSIANLITANEEEQRELVRLVASKKDTLNAAYVYIGKQACTEQTITSQVQTKSSTKLSDDASASSKMLISSTSRTKTLVSTLSKRIKEEQKPASKQGNSIIVNPIVDNTKQAIIKKDLPVSVLRKQDSILSPSIKSTYKRQQPKNNSPSITLIRGKALELHKKEAQDKREQAKPYNEVDIAASITNSNGIAKQLTEEQAIPRYIAKGGDQVYPAFVEGKWMAVVKEHAPIGFSRTHYLELYLAPGFTINELSKHSLKWQESHIAVVFAEHSKNGKGYVYIGEKGLLGGGKTKPDKQKDDLKGCDFSAGEKRPHPDKPGEWVCPGPRMHSRTAPKSKPDFGGSYGRDWDGSGPSNDQWDAYYRSLNAGIAWDNAPIYERINAISNKLLNKYEINNVNNIHEIHKRFQNLEELRKFSFKLAGAIGGIKEEAADLKENYTVKKYKELEEEGKNPYCDVPALKQLWDLEKTVKELNSIYYAIEAIVGKELVILSELVESKVNSHCSYIPVEGIIAKGKEIKSKIKQAIKNAELHKLKFSSGFLFTDDTITQAQKEVLINLLKQAEDKLDKLIDRALKIQKVNYVPSSKEIKQALRMVEEWPKHTRLRMNAGEDYRKKDVLITEDNIKAINKELEEPLNRVNRIIREETKSTLVIEECYDIRRKLHELIQRVKEFSLDQKALLPLRSLEKLDQEFKQKIKEEKHKIFVKSINEEVKRECDKVNQVIKTNSDIKIILDAASKFKVRVELMRERLKDYQFKREEVLAIFEDNIRNINQTISEQKEEAIKGATSQEEKQLVTERIKKAETEIKVAELKVELENYQAALEKYQEIKKVRHQIVIEAKERIKEHEGHLEYSRKEGHSIDVIGFHQRKVIEAKHLLKHAEYRLLSIETLIGEYTEKLKEAAQKLRQVQEEEQRRQEEIRRRGEQEEERRKAEEEARRKQEEVRRRQEELRKKQEELKRRKEQLKAEELKRQQQEEEVRRKVAERDKELEEKYPPPPTLQAAMEDIGAYFQAIEAGLLAPVEQKTQGQQLLKQMETLKAEGEASHKRIQVVYQSENSPEGDQLTEEELAAKEAQLGKIQELEGQLLAVLDLNIQELKECGIE